MKKFVVFGLLVFLSAMTLAQTNAFTSWKTFYSRNSEGEVTSKHIKATFTMDSTGVVLLSEAFTLDGFDGNNFSTHPATFNFQVNNSYSDTPIVSIRLMGCYQSVTDTVVLDTLRDWGGNGAGTVTAKQVVNVDSTGILEFNVNKFAPLYRISIRALRRDVNASTLDLYFRKEGK